MKPTMTILAGVLAAGLAAAQSPSVIQTTRATMNGVRDNAAAASNAALGIQEKAPSAAAATHSAVKASAGTAAAAVKPVPVATKPSAPKAEVKTTAKPEAKTPAKPEVKAAAKPEVKAAAKAEVKTGAKPVSVAVAPKPQAPKTQVTKTQAPKTQAKGPIVGAPKAPEGKKDEPKKNELKQGDPAAALAAQIAATEPGDNKPAEDDKTAPDKKWNANGKRDPFISPVVSHAGGSGCNTGKKCLEIGAINLRGIVHAESGFIAVVSNSMNKAYFLRENDPVFNGYVVKITGDSIVFQETLQDRLGKTFTREVVKKIVTPAV